MYITEHSVLSEIVFTNSEFDKQSLLGNGRDYSVMRRCPGHPANEHEQNVSVFGITRTNKIACTFISYFRVFFLNDSGIY